MQLTITTLRNRLRHLRLVDLIVIVALLLGLLFAMYRFSRRLEFVYLDLTFERQGYDTNIYPPEYWQVNQIKAGDRVYNALGNEVAEVNEVQRVAWGGGSREYTYITIKLKALYNKATKTYSYNSQQLVIGEKLRLIINNSNYVGLIKDIYHDNSEKSSRTVKKDVELEIYCHSYDAWHAEAIRNLTVHTSTGKVMAKIKFADIKPAITYEPDQYGHIVKGYHPDKKDIDLKVHLYSTECPSNTTCFYNQTQALIIGSEFWLDSGETHFGKDCSVKSVTLMDQQPNPNETINNK